MKASFYTESILYWLAKGLGFCAQQAPAGWNAAVGAGIGTLAFHALPKRRVVALGNLRAAFGAAYSPQEYRRILRGMFRHFGITLMEVARIPRIDRAYVDRWVEIAPGSRERLEQALAPGRGAIFLTGHFGNWELISITGALLGYPTLVLAREQGWPRLNALLTRYRESKGCRVVTKGFPIRELIRGLEQGRIVGILSDQDGGRNGVLAPFFGRLASTAPGAIALSVSTGAPILPVFITRVRGSAHRLLVEEPLQIPSAGPLEERIRQGTAIYLERLERAVRSRPDQWLWFHRRWKSSPQRRLLLLTDGRAGHESQMRGLADRIEKGCRIRARQDKRLAGGPKSLVRVETSPVAFRHPAARLILSALASCVPRRFPGGDLWLRLALTPDSYRSIRCAYADLSLSCGTAAAPVNLLFGWGIGCRTVQIGRSRWPSWRRFHLALIPAHDRPPRSAPNLLVTDGTLVSPHPTDPEQLQQWRDRLGIKAGRQIGFLLGGAARGAQVDLAQVQPVTEGLLEAARRLDAELLVTSSRRTSPAVERWLHDRLSADPRCRLLVLVNQGQSGRLDSTAAAVPCILGLSEAVVVSGDSVSMISEALGCAKPVVSFLPSANGFREPKYHRFLAGLERQGKIRLASPEAVGRAVVRVLEEGVASIEPVPGTGTGSDPLVEFLARWL